VIIRKNAEKNKRSKGDNKISNKKEFGD